MENKSVLVIAGPTGSGESTITNEIIKIYPKFKRLITATTRLPRGKEKHGKDYYFIDEKNFLKKIKSGEVIEYTYLKDRHVYYGSLKKDLQKKIKNNYNVIINPDLVGTKFYKKNYNAIAIFIYPENLEVIKERLIKRNPDLSTNELKIRLKQAKNELTKEAKYYDYHVLNKQNKLKKAVTEVINILRKEKYKLK